MKSNSKSDYVFVVDDLGVGFNPQELKNKKLNNEQARTVAIQNLANSIDAFSCSLGDLAAARKRR